MSDMLHWNDRLYLLWKNLRQWPVERRRWRAGADRSAVRVYYGYDLIQQARDRSIGGMLKSVDLASIFPNETQYPNLLYLVSSALPPYAPSLIAAAKRTGAVFVLNQNGVAYPGWCGDGWKVLNRPLRQAHEQADYVLYQSEFCRRAAERFLGGRRGACEVLYNPVDTRVFSRVERPARDGRLLLLAGSHQAFYRIQAAIDTLACLRQAGLDVRLQVAGRCLWRSEERAGQDEIRQCAARCGVGDRVTVSGVYTQAEAPALFNAADVLLHPLVNDNCPRLVVEAMACGLPVVYSATGGTPELVGPEAGVGVPGEERWDVIETPPAAGLAAAVRTVLADLPGYSAAARRRAAERFDVQPWLDRHRSLFQELMT